MRGPKAKSERNARILAAAQKGRTYAAIGREFHVSTSRVQEILARLGFQRRAKPAQVSALASQEAPDAPPTR